VAWQLSKRRAGTHQTKTISDVSGTGKKPYRQKGTGNARQGTLRAVQFRGGATVFGPVVRSHAYDLPKKVRKLALKMALSQKLMEQRLWVVDAFALPEPKTKQAVRVLGAFEAPSLLIIDGAGCDRNASLAVSNLHRMHLLPAVGCNVYDVLHHDHLLLTREGLVAMQERLL